MIEKNGKRLLCKSDGDYESSYSKKQTLKLNDMTYSSLAKKKVGCCLSEDVENGRAKKKYFGKDIVYRSKASQKRQSISDLDDKVASFKTKKNVKANDIDVRSKNSKERRIKKGKEVDEMDEASRLQRRTKYLLIKIKLEQNLIDAYSAEGWKGQSREKIKPYKELQRAKKQILKCKLGIREVIHQLDLLSSTGCINNSKVAPDGSVHHEHIICAICESQEAFQDNDIILCDGTCNRAFHQKCHHPPLSTDNIPPEDEGWFCKFCESKMEVLEATNAHLGTHFALDINWQDVFKELAALPDDGISNVCQAEEWPSDDSEDDDYDPERIERCCNDGISGSESNDSDCSSSFLGSLEDESSLSPGRYEEMMNGSQEKSLVVAANYDEINVGEVLCHPRQRAAVDYNKLYDEMFGKNAKENEEISDDEDWGPSKRRQKKKETEAANSLMILGENDKNVIQENPDEENDKLSSRRIKRTIFRLPHNAVEKLRLAFSENELPDRVVRESLSKQLGLNIEKINKWFKNARYMALKFRKTERKTLHENASSILEGCMFETALDVEADEMVSKDKPMSVSSENIKKYTRRKNYLLTNVSKTKQQKKQSLKCNQVLIEVGEDESLKHLREKARQAKKKSKRNSRIDILDAEAKMERLSEIMNRVQKLQQTLLQLPSHRFRKANAATSSNSSIIYVPIAEVREKRLYSTIAEIV